MTDKHCTVTPVCPCVEDFLAERESNPSFKDYNKISVPLTALRLELRKIQIDYEVEYMPLGELLKIIAENIKTKSEIYQADPNERP